MNENIYEIVEAYLSNTLSEKERNEFERQLSEDPAFQKEVKPILASELALKAEVNSQRRERFNQWFEDAEQEGLNKAPAISRRIIPFALIGSIAAALIFLLLSFWPSSQMDSPEKLYADNFAPYYPPETRGGQPIDSIRKMAHVLLLQNNYEEGIPKMELVIASEDLTAEELLEEELYLASAYLDSKKPEKALDLLQNQDGNSLTSKWYQALAHLSLGDWESAKPLLEELKQKEVPYYGERAAKILGGQ
ncbi:MAG: hypothetical protein MRZ79_18225 [Bacteroidia bacterium]|nr:hypothetical protein [Bacteroidia bacterium]